MYVNTKYQVLRHKNIQLNICRQYYKIRRQLTNTDKTYDVYSIKILYAVAQPS